MLSQATLQVIQGLAVLAKLPEGTYMGATAVAREVGAPQQYLGRLFQTLRSRGVLETQRGLGGGVRLGREPEDISLYEVIEPYEDIARFKGCLLGKTECTDQSACAVHKQWQRVRETYLELLTNTSIADLLDPEAGHEIGSLIAAGYVGKPAGAGKGEES